MDACAGKIGYETKAAAEHVKKRIRRQNRSKGKRALLNVYHCRCGKWHLGRAFL